MNGRETVPTPIDGEIPIPINPNEESEEMANALNSEAMDQTIVRFNDGSGFVAQESKQSFVLSKQMFQAVAQNLLEKEGLADTLLQLKSAGVYPNNLAPPA